MTDAHGNTLTATRPRIKKLRVLAILAGLAFLAAVSTVFGMMMAVASELPALESHEQYAADKDNSILLDYRGRKLGILQNNQNVVLVGPYQISPAMKHAIIAIEDRRFYTNDGYDLRGIGRALWADITSGEAVQGGSTITQQFVKIALEAQSERTVLQKLREAALAYHLTRKWSKEKILTEYLNAIYFGKGAYGIESAARVYFGKRHGWGQAGGCGTTRATMCAAQLTTPEAAFLAGIVLSPSGYDPVAHPDAAKRRRDLVLRAMRDQGYITDAEYRLDVLEALPTQTDLTPPQERSEAPYFTSWVRQQVVDHFGPFKAFSGSLQITTTLDLDMQRAAEDAIAQLLPPGAGLPSAALVAIENRTGEVRAMVGGEDYATRPFNLATQGQRQPGSTFKPFVLAAALQAGISPNSLWSSRKKEFPVPGTGGKEVFPVENYNGAYAGTQSLAGATTTSDNSVFAEVGIKVGTRRIARLARRLGIRTPVSTNYAMILGGLEQGVTPLDMAHAYQTFAAGGRRIWNPELGAPNRGPIGIHLVRDDDGDVLVDNRKTLKATRVLPQPTAEMVTSILRTVVAWGTGKAAALSGSTVAGKTGTTENYGDAWFVGWNERFTVAVWVGHPDKLVPMLTEFGGEPVAGGTYPALIWHNFMVTVEAIFDQREAVAEALAAGGDPPSSTVPSTGSATVPPASETTPSEEPDVEEPLVGDEDAPAPGGVGGPEEPAPAPGGASPGGAAPPE
jgi:penicillin-binding protein 1A